MITQPIPQPDNFQYVKLPDGSYGKFAADASDDVIKSAISKDFPSAFQQQPQGNSVGRFLKSAGSTYLNSTLNAGPTNAIPSGYGTPEWQQAEANPPKTNSEAFARMWQTIKNAVKSTGPINPVDAAVSVGKQFNPVSSDTSPEGLGQSAMNLLLLRNVLKQVRGGAPEFGSPNPSEIVQPLSGYDTTPKTRLALPPAPIQLGASSLDVPPQEGVLPAASRLYRDSSGNLQRQFLTRPLRPGEAPPLNRDVNTPTQSSWIDAVQEMMNRQTETESPFQTIDRRMQETAVTPFDRATPKPQTAQSPTIASASNLNSPGQVRGFQEQAAMNLFGKSYDSLTVQQKLQTLPEATRIQNAARSAETPRIPTSDEDMMNLLLKSIRNVQSKAKAAKAGD